MLVIGVMEEIIIIIIIIIVIIILEHSDMEMLMRVAVALFLAYMIVQDILTATIHIEIIYVDGRMHLVLGLGQQLEVQ